MRYLFSGLQTALLAALLLALGFGGEGVLAAPTCTTTCYVSPAGNDANSGTTAGSALASIQTAVDQVSPGGTVILAAGTYNETVAFIGKAVIIDGAGAGTTTINGGGAAPVFDITSANGVTIKDVTITNGGGGGGTGGGLNLTTSTVTVQDAVISGNTGGGIRSNLGSDLIVERTTISSNSGGFAGGGISSNVNSSLILIDSTVSGNSATNRGGGIYFDRDQPAEIRGSTISGNSAPNGGGIFNDITTLTVVNSTISGNTTTGSGGGIHNLGAFDSDKPGGVATTTLVYVTIFNNSAASGGGIYNSGTGANTASMLLTATLVGGSTGGNCVKVGTGSVNSGGSNVSDDGTCAAFLAAAGDANSVGLVLDPLASNGGPTQTHALGAGSPAIDKVAGPCIPGIIFSVDQRGFTRPVGAGCDSGAFEAGAAAPGGADLSVIKTVSSSILLGGSAYSYTLTVVNNGPQTATGVELVDTLPSGAIYLSAVPAPSSIAGNKYTFKLGDLTSGASAQVTINVKAKVPAVTTIIFNNVTGSSSIPDPNPDNNSATVRARVHRLRLVSLCSPDPSVSRNWRVINTAPVAATFEYQVYGTNQRGTLTAPPESDFFFSTRTVRGPNTTVIRVNGEQHDVKASSGAPCRQPASSRLEIGVRFVVDPAAPGAAAITGSSDVEICLEGPSFAPGSDTAGRCRRAAFDPAGGEVVIGWDNLEPGRYIFVQTAGNGEWQPGYPDGNLVDVPFGATGRGRLENRLPAPAETAAPAVTAEATPETTPTPDSTSEVTATAAPATLTDTAPATAEVTPDVTSEPAPTVEVTPTVEPVEPTEAPQPTATEVAETPSPEPTPAEVVETPTEAPPAEIPAEAPTEAAPAEIPAEAPTEAAPDTPAVTESA